MITEDPIDQAGKRGRFESVCAPRSIGQQPREGRHLSLSLSFSLSLSYSSKTIPLPHIQESWMPHHTT
jgi:hypothetical protein